MTTPPPCYYTGRSVRTLGVTANSFLVGGSDSGISRQASSTPSPPSCPTPSYPGKHPPIQARHHTRPPMLLRNLPLGVRASDGTDLRRRTHAEVTCSSVSAPRLATASPRRKPERVFMRRGKRVAAEGFAPPHPRLDCRLDAHSFE